jgi:hypothetical protein
MEFNLDLSILSVISLPTTINKSYFDYFKFNKISFSLAPEFSGILPNLIFLPIRMSRREVRERSGDCQGH